MLKPHRLAFLLFFLTSLLFFAGGIFGGKQLGPTEHIQTMVTPGSAAPEYGWDVLQADGVLQFYPWRDLVFDAWKKGQVPIVNPYQLAGQPLNANSQSAGAYPLHVLFAFLPLGTVLKMNLLGVFHLFVAGLGMYFWIRKVTSNEWAGLISGLLFGGSQFLIAWSPLASVPTTVAWIPWVLFGLHLKSVRGLMLVAISTALLLLGGHLQFAAYGLIAISVYAVTVVFQSKESRVRVLLPFTGLLLGGLIAAPQISLVLKNSQTSHRKNIPSEEGYSAYLGGALKPFEALSAVHPRMLGSTTAATAELKEAGLPTGYWPLFVKPNSNPAECALFILPVGLVLAAFAFRKFSMAFGAVAIALTGLLLAFGSPLNRLLFFNFPGWSATGSPGRAIVLYVLGVSALAGIGFSYLDTKIDDKKSWRLLGLAPFLLLAVGFNVLRAVAGMLKPRDEDFAKVVAVLSKSSLLPTLVLVVGSAAVLLVMTTVVREPSKKQVGMWIAVVLITLMGFHQSPLMGKALEIPPSTVAPQERVVHASKAWNMAATPSASMPPNLGSLRREHDLYGYDSILDKEFVEKLKSVTGKDPAPPENGNMMLYRGEGNPEVLKQLGVGNRIEGGEIVEDGYDQQVIQPQKGVTSILVRDRFLDGMTVSPSSAKIENENGFRRVLLSGEASNITIRYPGKSQVFAVLAMFVVAFGAFLGTLRNGKIETSQKINEPSSS